MFLRFNFYANSAATFRTACKVIIVTLYSMKQFLRFQVEADAAGQRLDEFLASHLSWLSRMRIATLLDQGACVVNDETKRAGFHVHAGDVALIALDEESPTAMTPEPLPLEIVYEDEHLLVVVKASGMLVHPTRAVKSGTLLNAIAYHLNKAAIETGGGLFVENNSPSPFADSMLIVRPGLVHRLDRATSGLMVIAKHQRALSILASHFHRRLVEKRYLALVHGSIVEDESLISANIGRDPESRPFWRVMNEGKPAETKLRVLCRRSDMSYIELEPLTGRTNQLRIHCAHIGYPIIGDAWYGSNSETRLCLHAARLAFHHPANGERMEFTSAPPFNVSFD